MNVIQNIFYKLLYAREVLSIFLFYEYIQKNV